METPPHFHAVARLIRPCTKLISSIVHRLIEPLRKEVLEILSDVPRVLAPTHVDVLEVLLRDRTVALLGLLEEFTPATGRLTKVINDLALPESERAHVTFKCLQTLGALP